MDNKKIAQTGLLVAVAFVFSYIESLIPLNLGIPGIKLGLSNLVVLFALYMMSYRISFGISMVRIFLVGLTFGNLAAMLYSLAGGLLSFGVIALLKRVGNFLSMGSVWREEWHITLDRFWSHVWCFAHPCYCIIFRFYWCPA